MSALSRLFAVAILALAPLGGVFASGTSQKPMCADNSRGHFCSDIHRIEADNGAVYGIGFIYQLHSSDYAGNAKVQAAICEIDVNGRCGTDITIYWFDCGGHYLLLDPVHQGLYWQIAPPFSVIGQAAKVACDPTNWMSQNPNPKEPSASFESGVPFRYSCTGIIKNFNGKYVLKLENPRPSSKYSLVCQGSVLADRKHAYTETLLGAMAALPDTMKKCRTNEKCRISGMVRGPFSGVFYWVKIDSASPR